MNIMRMQEKSALQKIKEGLTEAGVENDMVEVLGTVVGEEPSNGTQSAGHTDGSNDETEYGGGRGIALRCAKCGNEVMPGQPCCNSPWTPPP